MTTTLWGNENGAITCTGHGGASLTAAITARPAAAGHVTPLGTWVRIDGDALTALRAEFRSVGLPDPACETCTHAGV